MTKQNKILLGIGAAGIAAYFLLRKKKSFTNFTTIDYNKCVETEVAAWNTKVRDCMAQNPTSGEEKCCVVIGGNFVNGSCKSPVDTNQACCAKLGGTLNGTTCTDPTPPPTPPTTICPENEVLVNGACICPTGYHWEIVTTSTGGEVRNCVIDAPVTPPADTPPTPPTPPAASTSTTIVTPPPFFPGLSNLPTMGGPAGSGGGGGATDDKPIDLFDWIPWILAGMTTALSVVSEQKQA